MCSFLRVLVHLDSAGGGHGGTGTCRASEKPRGITCECHDSEKTCLVQACEGAETSLGDFCRTSISLGASLQVSRWGKWINLSENHVRQPKVQLQGIGWINYGIAVRRVIMQALKSMFSKNRRGKYSQYNLSGKTRNKIDTYINIEIGYVSKDEEQLHQMVGLWAILIIFSQRNPHCLSNYCKAITAI